MTDHLSPLPPDVEDALEAERARPGVSPITRERLRARLHRSIPASGSGVDHRTPWRVIRRAHPALTAAVGFVVGVTTGVAMHATLATRMPEEAPRRIEASSVSAQATVPNASALLEPPSPAPVVAPSASVSRDVHASETEPPVPSASTLTAERALLDVAHAALGDGRAADALSALGQHAQRFPHGVYREEREALTIQCLRALGRSDEAAARAALFKTRYPKSLFLAIVERPNGPNP